VGASRTELPLRGVHGKVEVARRLQARDASSTVVKRHRGALKIATSRARNASSSGWAGEEVARHLSRPRLVEGRAEASQRLEDCDGMGRKRQYDAFKIVTRIEVTTRVVRE